MTIFNPMGGVQKQLFSSIAIASLCVQLVLTPTGVRAAAFELELKCGKRNITVSEVEDPGVPKGTYEYITSGLHLTNGHEVTTEGQDFTDYEFSNGDYTYRVTVKADHTGELNVLRTGDIIKTSKCTWRNG